MAAPSPQTARLDKPELAGLLTQRTNQERGRWLRSLLEQKGIDSNRIWYVEYYPRHRCWLLTQPADHLLSRPPGSRAPGVADDVFYLRTMAELRRTALTAFSSWGGRSSHRGLFAREPPLPVNKGEELTPLELADALGTTAEPTADVHFTSEGGWQAGPRGN